MPYLVPKSQGENKNQQKHTNRSTHSPKISFAAIGIHNALEVHAEVRGEKRQGEEDDGDAGEDEDGVVLGVGDDGEFVLLDGFELEELYFLN